MKSNELIHRYLLGIASDDDVQELESRLRGDEALQDELMLQAELDAHLRQEAQLGAGEYEEPIVHAQQRSPNVWKWVSGVSTLAATVLLSLLILNMPPQQTALAYPSLGNLNVEVSRTEHNIWAAAADGDLNAVRKELEDHVSVNSKSQCGHTPLHVAALFDQLAVVELLLSRGADVSLTDAEGNTALHMAAFLGRTDIVRTLLKAGADPTLRNKLGFSSVDNVAIRWNSDLEAYYHNVEKALNTSLDLERIKAERPGIVRLLSAANINPPDRTPTISLWRAAMTGNTGAVEEHIAAGTDLDAKEDFGGSTPLMLAAIYGHTEISRSLIEAGADFELRNNSGGTALHQACFFCRPEIVKLLLKSGADPNKTNSRNLTPLDSVTIELNAELQAVYGHVYDSLDLEFDLDDVKATRPQIADMLRKHVGSKAGENGDREMETAK